MSTDLLVRAMQNVMRGTPAFALVALGACASLVMSVSARETTSLDAGWRFQLGDAGYELPCNTSAFSPRPPGAICKGGDTMMIFVTSAELCESACCGNPACTFWQFCDPAHKCLPASPGWGCYNGYDSCAVKEPATNWTGGARSTPPPPKAPPATCTDASLPCSPGFADGAWRTVNTPHDFVVEGPYSPKNDAEHGYLPFNVSWYRRHFTLDAARAGSAVWVDFDGVYKNSDVRSNHMFCAQGRVCARRVHAPCAHPVWRCPPPDARPKLCGGYPLL